MMGWVWKDDDDDGDNQTSWGAGNIQNPNSSDQCSTRKIVKSKCRTEEAEPGKFVRKCEKTEEILKSCVGRPVEVVQSNTEYTEDDLTNEMTRGGSFPLDSSVPFDFPGLRSDIESIERSVFGGLSRFFEAAEEMKNGFFQVFDTPHIFDGGSSPSFRREIPIKGQPEKEAPPQQANDESPFSDFAAQIKDV